MKYFVQFTLIVMAFALLPNLSKASCVNRLIIEPILMATKGERLIKYKIGSCVSIWYGLKFKKVNGKLIAITQDSIFFQSLNKKNNISSIGISDIHSIMKLHKKGRNGWITILTILASLSIVGLILLQMNSFLSLLVLGIPVVSLFTFIPFLLCSFLSDLFSKKTAIKGWIFSSKI